MQSETDTQVLTSSKTYHKVRGLIVDNQHASATTTVDGAVLPAGKKVEYPLLEPGRWYADIVVDGSSSSAFCVAVLEVNDSSVS